MVLGHPDPSPTHAAFGTASRLQPLVQRARTRPRFGVLMTMAFLLMSCLPNPQRIQSNQLLDQLVAARSALALPPQLDAGCDIMGHMQTRLYGEPGLVEVRPAWRALVDTATALQAVCGLGTLLRQPALDSVATHDGRQRWQAGIDRELAVACTHLREAASALDSTVPC
jgi:hypothetical protein